MIVYLNGEYMVAEQATISPLDRGFLFGDGIYDVTPSYGGRMVGLQLHMERMKNGLQSIGIDNPLSDKQWRDIAMNLSEKNANQNPSAMKTPLISRSPAPKIPNERMANKVNKRAKHKKLRKMKG